ncbi:MAG: hypothetical protein FJ304_14710 [Planctomycetes bacterium]|nr:hypothetical protein [Planctomycetota bacterium]
MLVRTLPLLALVATSFAAVARADADNTKALVGKWKVKAIGDKTDEFNKGIDLFFESRKDNTGAMSIESSDPKTAELVKMLNEKMPTFKWAVTGDNLELTSTKKVDGLFGGKEKGTAKIKIDGDKMTMTPDDEKEKAIKLEKIKR